MYKNYILNLNSIAFITARNVTRLMVLSGTIAIALP